MASVPVADLVIVASVDDIFVDRNRPGLVVRSWLCETPPMKRPNFYTGSGLDRVSASRKDQAWVSRLLDDARGRFIPVWRGQVLIEERDSGPISVLAARDQVDGLLARMPVILLGIESGDAHFALDLSGLPDPETALAALKLGGAAQFQDLRAVGPVLVAADGARLAYAKGLVTWHERHRFCGLCGHPTRAEAAGHVRQCTNESCGASHFPRTDPAVIMLVTDGDACLLGRQAAWPPGMYSTLAGFVEPGESLEEAVAREVFEESGVTVGAVHYHSSQPWPFPSSIMLGFYADATSRSVTVDQDELEDARWFDRDWIKAQVQDAQFRLPRLDSIARRLIEDWLVSG